MSEQRSNCCTAERKPDLETDICSECGEQANFGTMEEFEAEDVLNRPVSAPDMQAKIDELEEKYKNTIEQNGFLLAENSQQDDRIKEMEAHLHSMFKHYSTLMPLAPAGYDDDLYIELHKQRMILFPELLQRLPEKDKTND